MGKSPNYAVAYRDDAPWIGIQGVATSGDVDQMFNDAGLANWDVRTQEVVTDAVTDKPDYEVLADVKTSLVRLAMVKGRYTPVQNEALLDMAKHVTHGDVTADAMGMYSLGRQVFMAFTLGESVTIGDDEVDNHLVIRTSHDGSLAIVAMVGHRRLECQNMLTSYKSSAKSLYKMRHTATVEGRVQEMREALGVSFRETAIFTEEMEFLNSQKVTDQRFWEMVQELHPKPEKDVRGSVKKWENRTGLLVDLWNGRGDGGDTITMLDKTAYRAYNALNEGLMWYTTVRAGNVENALVRASGFNEADNKANANLQRFVKEFVS